MRHQIPRRIIQTGKHAQLALRERAFVSNIRLLNPDYEYLFFDDAQVEGFVHREFPEYLGTFGSFRYPIQRYDFFRYLAVFRYGGFYFDLDVLLAASLSPLLGEACVFPFERLTFSHYLRTRYDMDWEIGNYAFGAAAGHPFVKAIIDNCIKAQKDPEWLRPLLRGYPPFQGESPFILNSTGPRLCSRTLAEDSQLARTVTVLFPDDVRDFRNWNRFGEYGLHLMSGSWHPKLGYLRGKIGYHSWHWMHKRLLKRSLKSAKSRSHPSQVNRDVAAKARKAEVKTQAAL